MFKGIRHIFLLFLPAAGLLAGCVVDTTPEDTPKEIQFQVSTAAPETRAATIDSDGDLAINMLRVDAYFNGTDVAYLNNTKAHFVFILGQWQFYSTNYYWPIEGSYYTASDPDLLVGSLDFVGYVPYDLSKTCVSIESYSETNGPSFSCTNLPVTSSGQTSSAMKEFMYAYVKNRTADDGAVPLQFQHPFAKINIQVKEAHRPLKINSISFSGINRNGSYTHGSGGWTSVSNPGTLVIDASAVTLAASATYTPANHSSFGLPFLVLPQTHSTTDQMTINVNWPSDAAARNIVISNPVSTWEKGRSYTYTLDFSDPVRFGVVVDEWADDGTLVMTFSKYIFLSVSADDWLVDPTNSKIFGFEI